MQQKILEFIVDDQFIRAPHYTVVADSKDYLVARFSFSPQWQGLVKTAVFQAADGKAYYVVLDKDTCPIPQEVIQPTRFLVSVFGGDRLTADRAMVEVAASGFTANGATPPQPTPDVYNQLMEAVSEERQLAESAATTAAEKADLCVEKSDACATFSDEAESAATSATLKAEECTKLVSHANVLFKEAININVSVQEMYDLESHVRMDAIFADERATFAEESASIATESAGAAEQHKEEARQAAATAVAAAESVKNDWRLLHTFDVSEPTVSLSHVFSEQAPKEVYFEGTVYTEDKAAVSQAFTIGTSSGTTIWSGNASFGNQTYPKVLVRGHVFLSPSGTLVCDASLSLFGYTVDSSGKTFTSTGRFNESIFSNRNSISGLFLKVAGGFAAGTSFKIWGK